MRVAVTGGRGFIGRHVVRQLFDDGHEPIVLDINGNWNVCNGALPPCDAVIHLAGVLGTAELFDSPMGAVEVNINGTIRMLRQCRVMDARYVGITMPSVWMNPYQITKRAAKDFATAWHETYGVPVSHVRAFNVFGQGQKVHGVQKIIPTFATNAWKNDPIPIWGDGMQTVDLVHVSDVARMLVEALNFGNDEVLDAGTADGTTVLAVADMVKTITESQSEFEYLPMRDGETPAKVVAEGEGWDLIDWHPTFNAEQLVNTVMWYREDRA